MPAGFSIFYPKTWSGKDQKKPNDRPSSPQLVTAKNPQQRQETFSDSHNSDSSESSSISYDDDFDDNFLAGGVGLQASLLRRLESLIDADPETAEAVKDFVVHFNDVLFEQEPEFKRQNGQNYKILESYAEFIFEAIKQGLNDIKAFKPNNEPITLDLSKYDIGFSAIKRIVTELSKDDEITQSIKKIIIPRVENFKSDSPIKAKPATVDKFITASAILISFPEIHQEEFYSQIRTPDSSSYNSLQSPTQSTSPTQSPSPSPSSPSPFRLLPIDCGLQV